MSDKSLGATHRICTFNSATLSQIEVSRLLKERNVLCLAASVLTYAYPLILGCDFRLRSCNPRRGGEMLLRARAAGGRTSGFPATAGEDRILLARPVRSSLRSDAGLIGS